MRLIGEVAAGLGLAEDELVPYGRYKAKVHVRALEARRARPNGKLVVVSSITPTPPGDGKTTITIGLGQALTRRGRRAVVALREPSIGPCFGVKGGGTGGGRAQVVPADEINLHFTGDIHAVGSAHNLLAACLDNHLFHDNGLRIDPRQILFRRALDMNDRALRQTVLGLGGRLQGYPREEGFLITAASEVMALLCLAEDLLDLKARLGRILLAFTFDGRPVRAADLKVTGAMAALLRDAIHPNLVQTQEGSPALVHGGPFANIAHGCNSVLATKLALKLGEICVTEAGFGFDLGAEKFFDIKCGYAGLAPDAVVLVATARALKYHGGVPMAAVDREDLPAIKAGMANLEKHVEDIRRLRRAAGGRPEPLPVGYRPGARGRRRALRGARRAGGAGGGVRAGGRRRRGAGGRARGRARPGALPLPAALRLGGARQGQDRDDRDPDVRRRAGRLHEAGRGPDRPGRGAGLRRAADLHGQDPALPVRRPDPPRAAARLRGHGRANCASRPVPASWCR